MSNECDTLITHFPILIPISTKETQYYARTYNAKVRLYGIVIARRARAHSHRAGASVAQDRVGGHVWIGCALLRRRPHRRRHCQRADHDGQRVLAGSWPGEGCDQPCHRSALRGRAAISCGHCEACEHGHPNLVPAVRFCGTPPIDGSSQSTRSCPLPTASLPEGFSPDDGALLEPLGSPSTPLTWRT
jgi:hypothetical protein